MLACPHIKAQALLPSVQCTGDVLGSFVPQAVLNKDGQVLDIDLVLSEVVKDGDEVYVEFSEGPLAYRVR